MHAKIGHNKPPYYPQGDVILRRIEKLPEGEQSSNTLAYGEITGHHHTIVPRTPKDKVITIKGLDKLYVKVEGEGVLFHTDARKIDMSRVEDLIARMCDRVKRGEDFHVPQIVEEGVYEVGREKELNPFTKEIQRVQD